MDVARVRFAVTCEGEVRRRLRALMLRAGDRYVSAFGTGLRSTP